MSHFVRDAVTVEAAAGTASTNVTDYTGAFNGRVWAVGFYALSVPFETSYTLTLSLENTSQTFLEGVAVSTSLHWYYPRGNTHNTTGGAIGTLASTETEAIDYFSVSDERIKIIVDGTSDITTGQSGVCIVVVDGALAP